jgi:hypothetical protein
MFSYNDEKVVGEGEPFIGQFYNYSGTKVGKESIFKAKNILISQFFDRETESLISIPFSK